MCDFKCPPLEGEGYIDSKFRQNYMLSKPDIWKVDLNRDDKIVIISNNSFMKFIKPYKIVNFYFIQISFIKDKLREGLNPHQIRFELEHQIRAKKRDDPKIEQDLQDELFICLFLKIEFIESIQEN